MRYLLKDAYAIGSQIDKDWALTGYLKVRFSITQCPFTLYAFYSSLVPPNGAGASRSQPVSRSLRPLHDLGGQLPHLSDLPSGWGTSRPQERRDVAFQTPPGKFQVCSVNKVL